MTVVQRLMYAASRKGDEPQSVIKDADAKPVARKGWAKDDKKKRRVSLYNRGV